MIGAALRLTQHNHSIGITRRQRVHLREDEVAGEEAAMFSLIMARDNREGREDVRGIIPAKPVKMKIQRIKPPCKLCPDGAEGSQFSTRAALSRIWAPSVAARHLPVSGRIFGVAHITRKRGHVMRGSA
jgi:hypothetical protein